MDTKATTLAPHTPHGATWAGVFERVAVKTDMNGSVSQTPIQHTLVAAAGQGTPTVKVPMSSKHLRHSLGKKPNVVNGVAQITLNLKKRTVERVKSDYAHPLPLGVKVSYKLDGKPISGSDIKGKSGKVEVDYQLKNTTASPVSVCFKGFNGKVVKQKVTVPAPLYANVSLTLPKHVSQFTAPGALMYAARKGVSPQWWIAMFKPVGPTTQTLKLTMDTKKAKIPQATILVWFVVPEALTGSAPAQSAAAVGKAQAEAEAAAAKVQADVAALQSKSGKPSKARRPSALGSSKKRAGPSSSDSTSEIEQLQSQIATMGQADRAFLNAVGPTEGELTGSTKRLINSLTASTGDSIGRLTASTTRTINGLTAGTSRTIDDLSTSTRRSIQQLAAHLHRSLDKASLNAIVARAAHLQRMARAVGKLAGRLVPKVTALADGIRHLVATLPTPVANAMQLYLLFGQLNQDLAAFSPAVTTTPAFLKLQTDINAGQALAKAVSNSLNQIQTQARTIAAAVQTLQSDAVSLQTKIGNVVTAALANANNTTRKLVAHSINDLAAQFKAATAAAEQRVAGLSRSAQQRLSTARASALSSVAAARGSAQQDVTAAENHASAALSLALRNARRSVAADERKLNKALASAKKKASEALAAAKAQAKQSGQAALSSAQASAAQAEAAAEQALKTANNDYAQLLALNQQAVAWMLPGGDATRVTTQGGSLIYTISGS